MPRYREDIKGNVKNVIQDFEHGIRVEMANADELHFKRALT